MKKDIHPQMHPVIYLDTSSGAEFFSMSTMTAEKTKDVDGVSYYVIPMEVSSASHPFYTGKQTLIDTGGRVARFKAKMEAAQKRADAKKGAAKKEEVNEEESKKEEKAQKKLKKEEKEIEKEAELVEENKEKKKPEEEGA